MKILAIICMAAIYQGAPAMDSITLAYNLKRLLNLVSFEKLMAAVGGHTPNTA
jgi:hypothetical protein